MRRMPNEQAAPRSVRRRGIALLLGLVVAFGLGEVLVRVAQPGHAPRTAEYRIHPVSEHPPSWVYEPGSKVVFEWDGDPIGVLPAGERMESTINALGLRGPVPSPERRAVVMLGDSFTFGEGVAHDETFVGRLDAALGGSGLQLVNAGVAGHGTVEEAARLEGLLDACRPVAVVLVHVPNDAIPWQESADRGMDLLNVETPGGLRLIALARGLASGADVESWYLSYYTGERSDDWGRAREAMLWMAQTCAARNVRFGVVTFPLMHRLHDYPLAAITSLVQETASEAQAGFLDLTPAFADGGDAEDLWVHPADRHPNARAHAIAAEAMQPFVTELVR
jgi:lysophospholipase L1-like esterase